MFCWQIIYTLLSCVRRNITILRLRFKPSYCGRRKEMVPLKGFGQYPKKPDWVPKEIIRMKAMMPDVGCRKLADNFNRRFAKSKQMTVGKTYVSNTIRNHQYEIQVLRRNIKHRRPKPIPKNLIWGIDLTGKHDSLGKSHHILGIIDHATRSNLCLSALKEKTSIALLRHLLDAIEQHGKPKFVRTDNESCFTSRLFCFGLRFIGIKHQRIDKGCPWMNGRIERFFGTLKTKLNQWEVDSFSQLNTTLHHFRFWYNHVRSHQYLDGLTPAEAWQGINVFTRKHKNEYWFESLDVLLTGYYLKI